jgi:hypothetical protein
VAACCRWSRAPSLISIFTVAGDHCDAAIRLREREPQSDHGASPIAQMKLRIIAGRCRSQVVEPPGTRAGRHRGL